MPTIHLQENTGTYQNCVAVNSKPNRAIENHEKTNSNKKLKDIEISVPIVYGTISFWLAKKANDPNNEDLGGVVKRVVFELHPTFVNPTRVVDSPPFELSEFGWGEFVITISLFFHSDVSDKHLDLYHKLKLDPQESADALSKKKPVVAESYDEIVFLNPSEAFFARVQNHRAFSLPKLPANINLSYPGINENNRGDRTGHPLRHWFINFSEVDELSVLASARHLVQSEIGSGKDNWLC